MVLQNPNPVEPQSNRRLALFDLGFRPFFLLAGISAVLLVLFWLYVYTRSPLASAYYPAVLWHSHEMIFAYTVAVVAGFLLTAVRNWTGLQTTRGTPLAALVALWLAGRIAPLFAVVVPNWMIAAVDLAFLPVLAVVLAVPLLRKRQTHNLVFLFVLAALSLANVMIHAQMLGLTEATAAPGITLAVYLIVFLITVVAGRVIPFFTETAIPGAASRKWQALEYASLAGLLLLILLDLLGAVPTIIILVAVFTAIAHSARLLGWYQPAIWSLPLLWVLHLAYAWLIVGIILKAMAVAELINPMLAVHAFTTGAIGTMTLGMMARVTLGHTGRELRPGAATQWAFVLISLAGFSRVFLPLLIPDSYRECVVLSGLLWSAAFALFVFGYAGFLIRPRIDGKPG
jgi:uncharacterized protein involved in response to NO